MRETKTYRALLLTNRRAQGQVAYERRRQSGERQEADHTTRRQHAHIGSTGDLNKKLMALTQSVQLAGL
jgi:hypothetical protein